MYRFDTCSPAIQAYPSFLAENNYQDSTDTKNTAFQKGHNTKLGAFEWLSQQPKLFGALQQVMTAMQSSDWLRDLPVLDKAAQDETSHLSESPFLVDVGGGHGHQCVQVLEKHPTLKGRLVLQDLSQAVDKLAPIDGVQVMAQDFFKKQKVQGLNIPLVFTMTQESNTRQAQNSTTFAGSSTIGPMTFASKSCKIFLRQ